MEPTDSMAPESRPGRRMWSKKSARPMSMEITLRLPKMLRREMVRSPLRSIRQWLHSRAIWTIMYMLVKSSHSLPKMADTTGIRRLTQLE